MSVEIGSAIERPHRPRSARRHDGTSVVAADRAKATRQPRV